MYCVLTRYFAGEFFLILQPSCTAAGIKNISRGTKLCIHTCRSTGHEIIINFKLAKCLGLSTF